MELKDGNINLEIYHEDGMRIFISEDNGTGVSYRVNNIKDIVLRVEQYLEDNFLTED